MIMTGLGTQLEKPETGMETDSLILLLVPGKMMTAAQIAELYGCFVLTLMEV